MVYNKNMLCNVQTPLSKISCPLCYNSSSFFLEHRKKHYHQCNSCQSIFLIPSDTLSPVEEKKRYLEHNNDVDDPRYQNFVDPIVQKVKANFLPHHLGLDFGAGTGPVITKLLRDSGYHIETYDPFFCRETSFLKKKYDYIVCCEVMEHFHCPGNEFRLLRSMLNPNAMLLCMTSLFDDSIDFAKWHYKDDHSHCFFYSKKALSWIKKEVHFKELIVQEKLVVFQI